MGTELGSGVDFKEGSAWLVSGVDFKEATLAGISLKRSVLVLDRDLLNILITFFTLHATFDYV